MHAPKITLPEGWQIVDYNIPNYDDYYLTNRGFITQCKTEDFTSMRLILKQITWLDTYEDYLRRRSRANNEFETALKYFIALRDANENS